MNALVAFTVLLAVSAATANPQWRYGVVGQEGALLKGPAVKSTVVGPDGSAISSVQDAGVLDSTPKVGTTIINPEVAPVVARTGIHGGVVSSPWIDRTGVVATPWVARSGIVGDVVSTPVWSRSGAIISAPSGVINPGYWGNLDYRYGQDLQTRTIGGYW